MDRRVAAQLAALLGASVVAEAVPEHQGHDLIGAGMFPGDIVGTSGGFDIVGDDVEAMLDAIRGGAPQKLEAGMLPVGVWGLTPTSITTLTSATITAPLTAYARPDRLVIGQACCVALVRVTALAVGSISLLIGSQPIPCEAFRFDAVGTRLRAAVVASPSVPPSVTISNGTGGTLVAEGGFFGPATLYPPKG